MQSKHEPPPRKLTPTDKLTIASDISDKLAGISDEDAEIIFKAVMAARKKQ